MIDKNRI